MVLERGVAYLLGVICSQMQLIPRVLRPQAGTVPFRGMSGAPVLDQQGQIESFRSVSRTHSISS